MESKYIGLIVIGVVFYVALISFAIKWALKKRKALMAKKAGDEGGKSGGISNAVLNTDLSSRLASGGYYRWQADNQPVIQRTEEQQRIFDHYFVVKKKGNSKYQTAARVCNIFGVLFCLMGLAIRLGAGIGFGTFLLVVGAILLIVGIACSVAYRKSIEGIPEGLISHEEYEELVKKHIEKIGAEKLGLERLGLDESQVKEVKPIILADKEIDSYSLEVYDSEKHRIHSSTQYVMYLYITDDQLYVYKLQFDMCCNKTEEWTSEFFYKDICDVSSHVERNIIAIGKEKFEYSTVAFSIVSSNSSIGFKMDADNQNTASIQGMKQKIRERKNA